MPWKNKNSFKYFSLLTFIYCFKTNCSVCWSDQNICSLSCFFPYKPSFVFLFFYKVLVKVNKMNKYFSSLTLQEQPNLRTRLDDAFLLRFLRARKFDYDRALQLLLNYHAGRKAWPEVFQDLKPSTVKHVLDKGFLTVLPRPDPNGRYILCLRPGCHLLHLCHWIQQCYSDLIIL